MDVREMGFYVPTLKELWKKVCSGGLEMLGS